MTYPRKAGIARVSAFFALAGAVAVLLAGCTFFGSAPSTGSPHGPNSAPKTTHSAAPHKSNPPSAAVTIAAVSVDGRTLTVGGFVAGLIESGGNCSFWIASTSTGVVVKVASTGIENAGTTSCGSIDVPITKLQRGQWNVTLHYKSTAATLVSPGLKVEVP